MVAIVGIEFGGRSILNTRLVICGVLDMRLFLLIQPFLPEEAGFCWSERDIWSLQLLVEHRQNGSV